MQLLLGARTEVMIAPVELQSDSGERTAQGLVVANLLLRDAGEGSSLLVRGRRAALGRFAYIRSQCQLCRPVAA